MNELMSDEGVVEQPLASPLSPKYIWQPITEIAFIYVMAYTVYEGTYANIDGNLTDGNVGARRNRNIRDNLFVLGAVVNGKIVYRRTQMNAIALQKVTLNWANMKNWTNLNFAMLATVLKSVVTVRRN